MRLRIGRNEAAIALVGAAVLLVLLLTGGLDSPLVPLAALWLFFAARWLPALASAAAVGGTAAALGMMSLAGGVTASAIVKVVAVVAAGAVPAALSRGTLRRTFTRDGLEGARTSQPPSGEVEQRQELTHALVELCNHTQARRAVYWQVEADSSWARQFATSDGALHIAAAEIRGDPLGWVWQHGISLRLTPTPPWSSPDAIVVATRVERGEHPAGLVTFEFGAGSAVPGLSTLEGSLSQLRRLLLLQDERSLVSADRQRLELLVSALRRLPVHIDLHGFANGVLEDAIRLTGATGGALGVWQREEGRVVAVLGDDGGPPVGATFEPLESEMALAARAGTMLVREGRGAVRDRVPIATPADHWTVTPRCLAAQPLITPDGVVGVIALWSSASPRLDPGALELLRTLAPLAGSQLVHAVEYKRVRESSERDGLTGLFNRPMIDHALDAERARHERYGQPIAFLLIDVDHFKGINDRYGHEAGDAVLRSVARVIQAGVRDVDIAARFGGEEFAVLLPETLPEAAADVAERLRSNVELIEVPWGGDTLRVRISVGVSSCPDCVRDARTLVRSADAALYQAKVLGRNRVIRAPASG